MKFLGKNRSKDKDKAPKKHVTFSEFLVEKFSRSTSLLLMDNSNQRSESLYDDLGNLVDSYGNLIQAIMEEDEQHDELPNEMADALSDAFAGDLREMGALLSEDEVELEVEVELEEPERDTGVVMELEKKREEMRQLELQQEPATKPEEDMDDDDNRSTGTAKSIDTKSTTSSSLNSKIKSNFTAAAAGMRFRRSISAGSGSATSTASTQSESTSEPSGTSSTGTPRDKKLKRKIAILTDDDGNVTTYFNEKSPSTGMNKTPDAIISCSGSESPTKKPRSILKNSQFGTKKKNKAARAGRRGRILQRGFKKRSDSSSTRSGSTEIRECTSDLGNCSERESSVSHLYSDGDEALDQVNLVSPRSCESAPGAISPRTPTDGGGRSSSNSRRSPSPYKWRSLSPKGRSSKGVPKSFDSPRTLVKRIKYLEALLVLHAAEKKLKEKHQQMEEELKTTTSGTSGTVGASSTMGSVSTSKGSKGERKWGNGGWGSIVCCSNPRLTCSTAAKIQQSDPSN